MAFPTNTTVLDNFDRANGALGANWGTLASFNVYAVASNVASVSVSGENGNYWSAATFGPDVEVWQTVVSINSGANSSNGLEARLSSPTGLRNGYHLDWAHDGTFQLYRVDAGGYTAIGTGTTVTHAANVKIGLSCVGNVITGYADTGGGWTQKVQTTDNTYSGAGYIALHSYNDGGVATTSDNFGGGTVVAATTSLIVPRKTWRGYR